MKSSGFSKRGIGTDSQKDKHVETETVASAVPRVSVQPHCFPVLSTIRLPCSREDGCLLGALENEQEIAAERLAAIRIPCRRQYWELIPLMVSCFSSIFTGVSSLEDVQV